MFESCIEILRIVLVCAADVTPYPVSIGHEGEERVHVDVNYQCFNWSKQAEWADRCIVQPYNATEEKIKHAVEHHGSSN